MFGDVTVFARYVFFSPNFSFFVCATKNSKGFDPNRSNSNFLVYQLFHLFCSRVGQKWVWDCVICPYFFPGIFFQLLVQYFYRSTCLQSSSIIVKTAVSTLSDWKEEWLLETGVFGSTVYLILSKNFVTSSEILGVWWKRSKAGNLEGSCTIREV